MPDQVIVVVRPDDQASRDVLISTGGALSITEVLVGRPGQVAALNAGLAAVRGDITAITDDDTAPHADWLRRILAHFQDPLIVGVGGRDLVAGSNRALRVVVGQIRWQGRIVGNHHRGSGPPRSVDILKGSNMAFRTGWLRRAGFDERLRGSGAQVHNDLQLSLRMRAAGGKLVYDPLVLVDHFPAVRAAGDVRAGLQFKAVRDEVHNETLALLEFLSPCRRLGYLAWSGVVGTRRNPGFGMLVALLPVKRQRACEAFAGAAVGRALGLRSWIAALGLGRLVRMPSLKNIRGVALELRAGLGVLAGWRSRARWVSDIFLQRAPRALQGRRRTAVRTIKVRGGVRLSYRLNRGDLQSIREVWLDQSYRFPEELGQVDTIVDLGANIGLTSVYLATTHGARRLVAIEPVPSNADLVRQNLALNNIPGVVIEAAVAAADGVVYFHDAPDSNVGRVAEAGREVRALGMRTILAELGASTIDILKVDIEGAEAQLFSGDRAWLQQVRALMIEFHAGLVDYPGLVSLLEAEGFRHIPVGSVYPFSASSFVKDP